MLLILAYLLPVLLAAVLLLRCRLPQWTRVLLLLALPLFYIGHYLGLKTLPGWPSADPLPTRFELLGERIQTPDAAAGTGGYIELWVLPQDAKVSRLFRLPYSRVMHERLRKARQQRAEGKRQQGVREAGATPGEGSPQPGSEWRFRDLPRRSLPPKR